jgi:hypothetical protein
LYLGVLSAKEILVPVRQECWIVRGTPAASDGVSREIDVDATFRQVVKHLPVCQCGVGVFPHHRSIGSWTFLVIVVAGAHEIGLVAPGTPVNMKT